MPRISVDPFCFLFGFCGIAAKPYAAIRIALELFSGRVVCEHSVPQLKLLRLCHNGIVIAERDRTLAALIPADSAVAVRIAALGERCQIVGHFLGERIVLFCERTPAVFESAEPIPKVS